MLPFILRPALTLTALLTTAALLLRIGFGIATAAPQPFDLFTYPGCAGPCWQGLEIRQSEASDFRAVLDRLGVAQVTVMSFDMQRFEVDVAHLTDQQIPQILQFTHANSRYNVTPAGTIVRPGFFDNDFLWSVRVLADVCISDVVLALGRPHRAFVLPRQQIVLIYVREGRFMTFTNRTGHWLVDSPDETYQLEAALVTSVGITYLEEELANAVFPAPLRPARWSQLEQHLRQPCKDT